MMKYNSSGENERSLKKHIKENEELLKRLYPLNGDRFHENRIQAIKNILEGRRISLAELNDTDKDIVTVRTV